MTNPPRPFSGGSYLKTDVPRTNFDSFYPGSAGHGAFLAIFQAK